MSVERPQGGDRLAEFNVGPITQDWIARYAAGSLDRNPVHIDAPFARSRGLADTVVHGTLLMSFFADAVTRWNRDAAITSVSATFVLPVFSGSSVRVAGRVVAVEEKPDGLDVLLRTMIYGGDGRLAVVGKVAALVPPI